MTNNQNIDWRFLFLRQEFMHNEEFKKFATWHSDYAMTSTTHYAGDKNDYNDFGIVEAGSSIMVPYDQTWHHATVTSEPYRIRSLEGLWNAVKDIVTSRTQLIRDSRQSDRYYFVNDLYGLDWRTYYYMYNQHMLGLDIEGAERDMRHRIRHLKKHIKEMSIIMNLEKYKQDLTGLQMNLDKPAEKLTELDMNLYKPEDDMAELEMNLEKPD